MVAAWHPGAVFAGISEIDPEWWTRESANITSKFDTRVNIVDPVRTAALK